MTVVTDLQSGRILQAVEGKGKEDVTPFLEKLAKKSRKLEAVAMDMGSAYFRAVREVLPHVAIVFDRYHIMALINHAIRDQEYFKLRLYHFHTQRYSLSG